MGKGRYIDLSLFTDELRTLINAAAKIFPVEYSLIESGQNPNNYEYVRIMSGEHKREIYHWDEELKEWGLIGADDIDITWDDIAEKPTSYPPKAHQHSENDISDLDKYTREQIDNFLAGKADALHGHNELHEHLNKSILDTITQVLINAWNSAVEHIADLVKHITSEERALWNTVADKANTADVAEALSGKADTGHNHDGRYHTKAEVSTMMASKADKQHSHGDIYAPKEHEHDYAPLSHANNADIHVTPEEKIEWNNKSPFKYEREFLELRDHYGYMNIDGGAFDGGDGYYLMIDGGTF